MKVVSIQYNLQYLFFFYRELLKDDPAFLIPGIEDKLTTHEVLTSEFVEGLPLDKCFELDQESKNKVPYIMCISIGTPNIINFPFAPNVKLIIFRCPKVWAYYSLIIMCSKYWDT